MLPSYLQSYSKKEVEDIQNMGYVSTNFDSYGNALILSASVSPSSSLITVPLRNSIYLEKQIETLYDVNFTEFNVVTGSSNVSTVEQQLETYKQLYNNATQTNQQLLSQLLSIQSSSIQQ